MKSKINKLTIIFILIALAIFAIIVFFVWVLLNPEHAKIFIDKALIVTFMAAFFWVGWFFMKVGKKK